MSSSSFIIGISNLIIIIFFYWAYYDDTSNENGWMLFLWPCQGLKILLSKNQNPLFLFNVLRIINFHKNYFITHGNSFTGSKMDISKYYLMAISCTCARDIATIVPGLKTVIFFSFILLFK